MNANIPIPESCTPCHWRDPEYGNDCILMPHNPFKTSEELYEHCPIRQIEERMTDEQP